jgi:hypothetical protein
MNVAMKKLRIYLDTSVINFLFADDAPDFRRVTQRFFDYHARKHEWFFSNVVLVEIQRDSDPEHRHALLSAFAKHGVVLLTTALQDEVQRLAELYLARGIVPLRKRDDALHIACHRL